MLCKKTDWTNFLLDYFKERKTNIVMNPRINLHKASLYIRNIFTTLKIQSLTYIIVCNFKKYDDYILSNLKTRTIQPKKKILSLICLKTSMPFPYSNLIEINQ